MIFLSQNYHDSELFMIKSGCTLQFSVETASDDSLTCVTILMPAIHENNTIIFLSHSTNPVSFYSEKKIKKSHMK